MTFLELIHQVELQMAEFVGDAHVWLVKDTQRHTYRGVWMCKDSC